MASELDKRVAEALEAAHLRSCGLPVDQVNVDDLKSTLTACNLTLVDAGAQGWMPIETAPRDGRLILWHSGEDDKHVCVINYPTYVECFELGYWQPLPAAPKLDTIPAGVEDHLAHSFAFARSDIASAMTDTVQVPREVWDMGKSAAAKFCAKVDRGEARCKESYKEFAAFLEQARAVEGGA